MDGLECVEGIKLFRERAIIYSIIESDSLSLIKIIAMSQLQGALGDDIVVAECSIHHREKIKVLTLWRR